MPKLACSKFICSTHDTTYLMYNKGVKICEISFQHCTATIFPTKVKKSKVDACEAKGGMHMADA